MCGLTAVIKLGARSNKTTSQPNGTNGTKHENTLEKQIDGGLEIVKHRGPDARGQWISPDRRVGLGQVRLSIIDLSPEGNQPFHDEAGDVHAVVNGELYDYEDYREKLGKEYSFKGRSDCEIVLALYQHYGLSFMQHLRGEFAMVIYDAKRKLVIATRDRYGIKSLYYTIHNGKLLIATEMKSFLAYGWKPEWDVPSIREKGWLSDTRTIFQGVKKVHPGTYLVCRNFGDIEQKVYWDMDYPDKHIVETRTEEEMILGVRERLVEAVKLRLRADVPVGVYLSGGLDSSAVAGITAHLIKEKGVALGDNANGKLKCFTVQFDKDSGHDESDIAQRTAEWLGVEFIPVHMDEAAMASRLEDVAYYSETFTPDVNAMGKLAMAEEVHSRGFKVVVTGEGSDEHFAGYAFFEKERMSEIDHSWTSKFNSQKEEEARAKVPWELYGPFMMGEERKPPPPSTARMLNGSAVGGLVAITNPLPYSKWTDCFAGTAIETVVAEGFDARISEKMQSKWHPLNTAMFIWTKTMFPNILLRYVGDNVDMVHHVESRTPFLDHRLTEYAMTLPPALKMKFDPHTSKIQEKWILREAVKPFVTEEIYTRRKVPFLGPVQYTADGPLYKEIKRIVTKENVENLGFLDWSELDGQAEKAFVDHEHDAFRVILSVAQLITIGRRFGVAKASPPEID